ncbi:hypothetical protein AK88_05125 [Plasmodium fragile]|uniref:AP2/ERF domain-containing protein n=1 Tax=Plasmodium fragile TaxID=5857 RepID=A0A0D9QHR5_PLAFR|nr:uncharacterized protein AK88_05125 [Plasmodium fragile]KJP85256.1 hypothetical protein AK88_05125 [Plasmodium fragile]
MEERLNEAEEIFKHSEEEVHPSVSTKGQHIYEPISIDKKAVNFNNHMAHANDPFLLNTSDKGCSREYHLQNAPYVNLVSAYVLPTGLSISHPSGDRQSEIRPSNRECCMESPVTNTPMSSTTINNSPMSSTTMSSTTMNRSPMSSTPMNTSQMTVRNRAGYIQSVPINYQLGWTYSNESGGSKTQGIPPSENNPNEHNNGISHLNSSTTSMPHNPCACPNLQCDKNGDGNLHDHPSDVLFNKHPTSGLVYHPDDGYHIGSRTNSIYVNRSMVEIPSSEGSHVIPPNGSTTNTGSYHVSGEGTNQVKNLNRVTAVFPDQWSNEELVTNHVNTSNYRIRRKGDSPHDGESYEMCSSEYEPTGQSHLQQRQYSFASSEGCIYPKIFQPQTQLNPNRTLLVNTSDSFPVKSAIREDGNFSAHMDSSRDDQPLNPRQGIIQLEKQMDSTHSTRKNPLTLNRIVHPNNSTSVISDNMIGSSYVPFVNNEVQNGQNWGEEKFFPIKGNYRLSSIESLYPFDGNQMGDPTSFMKLYNNGNTSYGEDTPEVSAWLTRGSYSPKEALNNSVRNTKESHSSLICSSGDGGTSPHMCSSSSVHNLTGAYDMPQRSMSSSSRQLSLLDAPDGVNNEEEETLQRHSVYDLYVQSLLNGASGVISPSGVISSNGAPNPSAQWEENNDQLILYNLKNLGAKITNKAPQMTKNYLSYLDHYISSLRLLYNKLHSNRNLIFILAKEVFAPKKKRDKKKYSDDNGSTFESKHSYIQELLAALLPQPPVFPPLEIWIYMGKKNASQLHKLHLTIYIIYQKIICNISSILLKINNDMVSYASKNKFSKRNGTDSLNDYVNESGEGVKRNEVPFLSASKEEAVLGGPHSSEYVAKRGVRDREGVVDVEEVDYLVDKGDSVDTAHAIRETDDAMCVPVEPNLATRYNRSPSQTKEDEPNFQKGDISRNCLFRIDQKLAIMMASIDNISKMINLASKGGGRSNSSKDPSVDDAPDEESKTTNVVTTEQDNVDEDGGNNIKQDDKSGLEKEGNIVKHTQRVSKGISPSGCCPPHISISPKDGQIVAYDEVKGSDDVPLIQKMAKCNLNYCNSIHKDNPVKLLNELKYELRNVYNEVRSLMRHDSYYLSSKNKEEAGSSLELVNPNDDHGDDYAVPSDGTAVSNMNIKTADETCFLNDFLISQSESSNPLVNAHTQDYYPCTSKKNEKKIKLENQNELLNNLINSSICSKEEFNNDIIYDLKYTDDVFKKLLFLCRNFYTNLSEYKDYALESFHENEVDLTNLDDVNNFRYMDNQAFFTKRPLLPRGDLLPQQNFPAGRYQLEARNTPHMCNENGDMDIHNIEQVNDHPFKGENHTSNVAPVIDNADGDDGVNSGEETLLSEDQGGSTNCAKYVRYAKLGGASMYDTSEGSTPNNQEGLPLFGRNAPWVERPMEKKEDKEGTHQVDSFFAKFDGQEELMEAYTETPQSAILQMGQMDKYTAGACTGRKECERYSPSFSKATNGDYEQMELGFSRAADGGAESRALHTSPDTLFSTTQSGLHYNYHNQQPDADSYAHIRSSLLTDTSHVNSEHPYVQRALASEGIIGSMDDPYVQVKNTEDLTSKGTYMDNSYMQNHVGEAKKYAYLLNNAQNVYYPNEDNLSIGFENTEGIIPNDCAKYEMSIPNAYSIHTNRNVRSGDSFQGFSTPITRCLSSDGSCVGGDIMGNCVQVPQSPYHKNQPFGMFNYVGANGFAATDTDAQNDKGMNRHVGYYTDESAMQSMINYQGTQNNFQKCNGKKDMGSHQFATNGSTNNYMSADEAGMMNQFSFNDEEAINMHRLDNMPQCTSSYQITQERNTFKDVHKEGENLVEKMYNHNGNYLNNIELRADTTEDVSDNEMNNGGGNPEQAMGDDENTFDEGSAYLLKNGLVTNDTSEHWKLMSNIANNLSGEKSESLNGAEDMNSGNLKAEEMVRNNDPPDADILSPESPNDYPNMKNERRDHSLTNDENKIKLRKMLEITDKLIGKKYRGISYDPTRNGWSTFVYKKGVRTKKFFSSYKYGNLLAKKKSIEWRLKNLSPDSNAYVFSLKAKEEFNAILNDGYADIKNMNCDMRDGESNGGSSNNRDILYVNAFINLLNNSQEGQKDESDEPDDPLCQMDKSSHEECAEELTKKGTKDGSGSASSEIAKSLEEANYKVAPDLGGEVGGTNVVSNDDRTASSVDRETPCASEDKTEGEKTNYEENNSVAQIANLTNHLCDQADGCLHTDDDFLVYKKFCSILLNEGEALRSQPNGREAGNGSNVQNGQNGPNEEKGKVDNLNDAAQEEAKQTPGAIPDQTAHFQIVNNQNEEPIVFPHSNDVSPAHCAALASDEGLDPRIPIRDNCPITPRGNRKKRKRHIIKGEGKKPIGEGGEIISPTGEANVTGTGEQFSSTYAAPNASAGGCSDSSYSDLYGSDTRSCDGPSGSRRHDRPDGDGNEEKFKRWMDNGLIQSIEGSHFSFEEEDRSCKNDAVRDDNSERTLQYVKECISNNVHLKSLNCGIGRNDHNMIDTLYKNVRCYPHGNSLTSGEPLLNGVSAPSEESAIKTFYPVECRSIPQERLVDGIVNRAEPQHMGGEKDNNLCSGDISINRFVELSHEVEKQVAFQHERDLFLDNKRANDKNCLLEKNTLLRYMNECVYTGEEEKNLFHQFLQLTPQWVLLQLDELEQGYHAYFRKKIESFYKAYLVKIRRRNSSNLRKVAVEGSYRSASDMPPKRNDYMRELQLIFDKKLSTLWTCMIFPVDFLYLLYYKVFRMLKRMNKDKVTNAKEEKDKQLKCMLKGINFIKYKNAWSFSYIDLDDKRKEKIFPINHYGFVEAKTLSILYRKNFVLHLSKMYTFLKNVLLRNKKESGTIITKLINPKSINHFIEYYKKYEEFLICYGKIVYFYESKNVFLTTQKKKDALNYVPFEIRHKMSAEIEPLNLITATRNYFSKKSQMINFPKGIVYLSGYFLWVLLFLNHNNKEVVISFSARKYSFETAKARCFECYYCLLYKYKFRPINISGVVDLILETDLECKNYNLLDYQAEEIMPLDYLFHFFAPSNYVLQNGVIYKRLLLNQHHREGYQWRQKYDSLFPSEYVSLDTFQTYEIEDDYSLAMNEVHGDLGPNESVDATLKGCMDLDGEGYYTHVNLLNDAEVDTHVNLFNDDESMGQNQYFPFELPSLSEDQSDYYPYDIKEHNEGSEYPAQHHRRSSDSLLLCQDMEEVKKDTTPYFTDDENGKLMRLKRRDNCYLEGRSFKRGNYTNLRESSEEVDSVNWDEYYLHSDSDGSFGSSDGYEEAAEDETKIHGTYDPSNERNEDFTMLRSEREEMTSLGMQVTCGNSNVRSLHGGQDNGEEYEMGENHPTVNAANGRGQNGQVSSDTTERHNDEENDYHHVEKKEQTRGGVIGQDLYTKECSNHEQSTQGSKAKHFINSAEYYKDVWNKNIFHFLDNNIQDEYLKRNYDSLFNSQDEQNVVFKKMSAKEEHLGVFLMLNCQWLSDSFVHNINQIETKYADIYSFENYLNTREEVLNWKCEKNFIKDCAGIAKQCPRVVGVHYDTRAQAWVVNCTSNGKRRNKKFLVKTFGFLQARKMAIAHRKKWQQQKVFHRIKHVNGKRASHVETL